MNGESETCRLDKWLWHARFVKTRTLAQEACASGRIRVNGTLTAKAHQLVRPGDVLTFPLHGRIRLIRVLATAPRRGTATLARQLYDDLEPLDGAVGDTPPPSFTVVPAPRAEGSGRPTKRERRETDRLRER
jgi:ribosome-associated heat shock protein Hsp15